jgi:hypothetical protein
MKFWTKHLDRWSRANKAKRRVVRRFRFSLFRPNDAIWARMYYRNPPKRPVSTWRVVVDDHDQVINSQLFARDEPLPSFTSVWNIFFDPPDPKVGDDNSWITLRSRHDFIWLRINDIWWKIGISSSTVGTRIIRTVAVRPSALPVLCLCVCFSGELFDYKQNPFGFLLLTVMTVNEKKKKFLKRWPQHSGTLWRGLPLLYFHRGSLLS